MRFTHIDVNSDITYNGNQKPQSVHGKYFWPILVNFIFDIKLDINICKPHYINLLLFVSLLHSPDIWLLTFDNLTSFWQFDIFLTFWHLFDMLISYWHFDIFFNFNHLSPSQSYFFIKFFGGRASFSLGNWYPCFGLLLIPVLGFKAKACMLPCLCYLQIHLWCDTCWLYGGQHSNWAFLIHMSRPLILWVKPWLTPEDSEGSMIQWGGAFMSSLYRVYLVEYWNQITTKANIHLSVHSHKWNKDSGGSRISQRKGR